MARTCSAFEIANSGSAVLKLYDIQTSCMCTTARLQTPSATSRKYGMHERSSDLFEVLSGETADVIVEFSPASHGPSGIGSIARTVTIRTNDARHPRLLLYMTADVVKR